jgi:aldehyde:ferredoxin oxidoreductase
MQRGSALHLACSIGVPEYAKMVSAATGMQIDVNDLMQIGERIRTMQKVFTMKEGYGKSDDTLPARLLTESLK